MSDGAIYASADLTLCTVPATVTTMGLGLRSLAAALTLTLLPACGGKKTATTRFVMVFVSTMYVSNFFPQALNTTSRPPAKPSAAQLTSRDQATRMS